MIYYSKVQEIQGILESGQCFSFVLYKIVVYHESLNQIHCHIQYVCMVWRYLLPEFYQFEIPVNFVLKKIVMLAWHKRMI